MGLSYSNEEKSETGDNIISADVNKDDDKHDSKITNRAVTRKSRKRTCGLIKSDSPESEIPRIRKYEKPTGTREGPIHFTPEKNSYLAAFFQIYDDDVIQDFLWMDSCCILADSYLLAMVYTYFRRAKLPRSEYCRMNFFAALYLSHDMEEDNEDLKLQMYPWVLGAEWKLTYKNLINKRDALLEKMNYRALVSKQTCDEIMKLFPSHPIWARVRKHSHGGTQISYGSVYEPSNGGQACRVCLKLKFADNESLSTHANDVASGKGSECTGKSIPVSDVGLSDVLLSYS